MYFLDSKCNRWIHRRIGVLFSTLQNLKPMGFLTLISFTKIPKFISTVLTRNRTWAAGPHESSLLTRITKFSNNNKKFLSFCYCKPVYALQLIKYSFEFHAIYSRTIFECAKITGIYEWSIILKYSTIYKRTQNRNMAIVSNKLFNFKTKTQ